MNHALDHSVQTLPGSLTCCLPSFQPFVRDAQVADHCFSPMTLAAFRRAAHLFSPAYHQSQTPSLSLTQPQHQPHAHDLPTISWPARANLAALDSRQSSSTSQTQNRQALLLAIAFRL